MGNELYNSLLRDVSQEIDASLRDASFSIESFLHDQADEQDLITCLSYLHQVSGALEIIGNDGGLLLANELESLARNLKEGRITNPQDAIELLTRGIMELPRYINLVIDGEHDHPAIFLPLVNEMRVLQNKKYLPEVAVVKSLPVNDFDAELKLDEQDKDVLKQTRNRILKAIVEWLKGNSSDKVTQHLHENLHTAAESINNETAKQFLALYAAVTKAINEHDLVVSNEEHHTIASIDKYIQALINDNHSIANEIQKRLLYNYSSFVKDHSTEVGLGSDDVDSLVQLHEDVSRIRDKIRTSDGEEKHIVTRLISDELQDLEGHVESILHNHVYENWNTVVLIALNIRNSAAVAFDEDVSNYINSLVDELDQISLNEENIEESLERAATIITTMGMVVDQNIFSSNHYLAPEKGSISNNLLGKLAEKIHDDINDISDLILANEDVNLNNNREDIVKRLGEIAGAYDFINQSIAEQIYEIVKGFNSADQSALGDSVVISNFVSFLVSLEEYGKYLNERSSQITPDSVFGSVVDELKQQISLKDDDVLNLDDLDIELDITETEEEVESVVDTVAVSEPSASQDEDDELIEIFIEEANELLETIDISLVELGDDFSNGEAIGNMRRAFHSLKGSGRVAGATSIGEIAWDVEQELNQIIERNADMTDTVYADSALARELIQELVEHFRNGVTEVPEVVSRFMQGREGSSTTDESTNEVEVTQVALDPVLHEIYSNETNGHLTTIESYVDSCGNSNNCYVSEQLVRALHTITGSSEMAQVKDVAKLASATEKYANHLDKEEQAAPAEFLQFLSELVLAIRDYLPTLLEANSHLPQRAAMLERLQSLYQIKAEVEEEATADSAEQELFDIFLEEAEEILDRLDTHLSILRINYTDNKIIQSLQRELHTLKGSSRMANVFNIADLSHATENVFNAVLNNKLDLNKGIYHLLQRVQSKLLSMIDELKAGHDSSDAKELIHELEFATEDSAEFVKEIAGDISTEEDDDLGDLMDMALDALDEDHEIKAETASPLLEGWDADLEDNETVIGKLLLDSELPTADTVEQSTESGESATEATGDLEEAVVELAISDDAIVKTAASGREVQDSDLKQGSIERATQVRVRSELLDDLLKSSGQITIYNTNLEQKIDSFKANVGDFVHTVEKLKEQIKQLEIETESQIRSGNLSGYQEGDDDFDPLEFDRYSQLQTISRGLVESLNDLENIESDLSSKLVESENLITLQNRINTELHEGIMRSRMVPFSSVLPRLNRVVTQAAHELNKEVHFNPVNADKEIDNNLLQNIIAPIEHILRNAVAHGIESAQERQALGKQAVGDITLELSEVGTELIISISDDGAGLNLEKIREKAISLGLIDAERQYSDDYISQLILESGLSTAAELNQISGRGVGMDVVANDIKHHGGILHIASEQGMGTSFTIHLPQKLSLTQALLVRDGEQIFALPVSGVEGFEYLNLGSDIPEEISWRGETYKFIQLSELLSSHHEPGYNEQAVPVIFFYINEQRYALISDDFLGNREIIIKPLGPQLETVPFLNGGAILGTGEIALIINLPRLLRLSENLALQAEKPKEVIAPEASILNVLIVDDSLTVRKVTSNFIKRNEMNPITARDGVDAIAVLEESLPDIILLDIEMPRMNGYEFLQYIRADERTHDIPVIMITSRTGEKHKQKAIDMGVNAYLGKPYQEDVLLEQIHKLTKR